MEERDPMSWGEVRRIIQSVPCSDAQLQRLADCAQVDREARVLELANTLTLSAQCWGSMLGCPIEVVPADSFFARAGQRQSPRPALEGGDPNREPAFEFTPCPDAPRYDCIFWHLDTPKAATELERLGQQIRASLGVNGCLILTLPVRIGLKTSADVNAFYEEIGARPMLPGEVAQSLEASGFEPLLVEFTPNRQTLARYRMIERALAECDKVDEAVAARWKREVKLFLKEGGEAFFPSAVFVARRWEYVDGS